MIKRLQLLAKRIDFYLVLVIVLCLFTLRPLIDNPQGLPNGNDVLYHTFRVAEMDRSWSHGEYFPRWAEGLYYGYGSPLFHYYASSTYYLSSLLMRIFALTPLEVLRWLIVLSLVGGGVGMYLFAKIKQGYLAGVIAALVYVYSPYLLYTEPYARGTYPELLSFALFPFVMWRFERLRQHPTPWYFVFASIGIFLLIITHNLMALTFTAIIGLWVVWEALPTIFRFIPQSVLQGLKIRRVSSRIAPTNDELLENVPSVGTNKDLKSEPKEILLPHLLVLLAILLGVALAGYFWIPVLLESDAVSLSNLTAVALLDYRNFFISLSDLLGFAPRIDEGAINGLDEVLTLGVSQWIFALSGIICIVALKKMRQLFGILFFALLGILMIFLVMPQSEFIWEIFSPLSYLAISMANTRSNCLLFSDIGWHE